MDLNQKSILELDDLPAKIKSWLGSARLTYALKELNERFGITGAQRGVIADLVYEIATRNTDPRDTVSQLALGLNLTDASAKILAQELEKVAFHPIEEDMQNLGINVIGLHLGLSATEYKQPDEDLYLELDFKDDEKEVLPPRIVPVEMERHIETPITNSQLPISKQETTPAGPFILHAERQEIKPLVQQQASRPTFSIKIPITQKKYYSTPAPVVARIETPSFAPQSGATAGKAPEPLAPLPMKPLSEIVKTAPIAEPEIASSQIPRNDEQNINQTKKIVHYSSFYTKL